MSEEKEDATYDLKTGETIDLRSGQEQAGHARADDRPRETEEDLDRMADAMLKAMGF